MVAAGEVVEGGPLVEADRVVAAAGRAAAAAARAKAARVGDGSSGSEKARMTQ